ncbi:MAG TPA: hypothetical protein DDZ62_01510, partial [Delftia acidovorans]|nr:hypothetical protein [Delftia acidovorans]
LGSVVAVTAQRERGSFRVELQPRDGLEAARSLVLESAKWADASWTQLLLRLMQKGCVEMQGRPQGRAASRH